MQLTEWWRDDYHVLGCLHVCMWISICVPLTLTTALWSTISPRTIGYIFYMPFLSVRIPDDVSPTTLQKFYQNKSVFLTGGTGFLGKIIIEKLLRSCEIDTIYVLVRSKKGKDIATRLEDIVNDVVFEKLKKQDKEEKFRHKIVPIEGDCSLPGLGMSDFDRQKLIENCNIVFHAAATVRFDEKLKLALAINVNGTREIMTLSKQLKSLVVSVVWRWWHKVSIRAHYLTLSLLRYFFQFFGAPTKYRLWCMFRRHMQTAIVRISTNASIVTNWAAIMPSNWLNAWTKKLWIKSHQRKLNRHMDAPHS